MGLSITFNIEVRHDPTRVGGGQDAELTLPLNSTLLAHHRMLAQLEQWSIATGTCLRFPWQGKSCSMGHAHVRGNFFCDHAVSQGVVVTFGIDQDLRAWLRGNNCDITQGDVINHTYFQRCYCLVSFVRARISSTCKQSFWRAIWCVEGDHLVNYICPAVLRPTPSPPHTCPRLRGPPRPR